MDLNSYRCTLAGCKGPQSGICINDLAFEECPDLILIENEQEEANQDIAEDLVQSVERSLVSTLNSGSLDAVSCDALLRERGGIVVGVVAGPEVGKTTMISTIYEMVHRGKIKCARFAGSETLRGYEERCHLARMSSNRSVPDTPRTPTWAKLSFTHLKVLTSSGIKELIFSDRSGEHFDNILDKPNGIMEFSELVRADVLLVLVDTEQLLKSPHVPTSRIRRLVMAIDKNVSLVGKSVRLVGTKSDLASSSTDRQRAQQALDDLAKDLRRRTADRVSILPLLIATRPKQGSKEMAEGLEELLHYILSSEPVLPYVAEHAWPNSVTELDALMFDYRSKQ